MEELFRIAAGLCHDGTGDDDDDGEDGDGDDGYGGDDGDDYCLSHDW